MQRGITYHIITIVAVFTALGVGIFIGSMLNGEKLMVTQQNKLMKELNNYINIVAMENDTLKMDVINKDMMISFKEDLIYYLFQNYLRDELDGYNIALIATGDYELCDDMQLILQQAGAYVSSVTLIDNLVEPGNDNEVFSFNNNYKMTVNTLNLDENESIPIAAENLMYSILDGKYREAMLKMDEKELIENSEVHSDSINYVILIGPNSNGREYIEMIDIPMLCIAQQSNIPCLVIERSSADYSAVDIFKRNEFSTVDHIDTVFGKVAMIKVLQGMHGNFGINQLSSGLLPDFSYPKLRAIELMKGGIQ